MRRRGEVQRGDARRATAESLRRRRGWQAGARAGREWMGIRVRDGEGAPAGSYKAGAWGRRFGPARGAWLPGPRPLARSRPLAGAGEAGRGRPTVGVAGPDRAEVVLAGRAVPLGRPNWRPKHGLVHGPCLARAR